MKKIYSIKWQEILFTRLSNVHQQAVGSDFYKVFFVKLFEKYLGYENFSVKWMVKRQKYHGLLNADSFVRSKDSFLTLSYQKTNWIEGRNL